MEFSVTQKKILDAKEPIIFVSSASGSGKTAVLTEKVRRSIKEGKKVVAFTFTNMASGEMKKRLGISNSDNVYIGTIHSYCAYLLLRKGIKEASQCIENEDFDGLFRLMNLHPECAPDIDICLCDEAQDSNEPQLKFIFEILHPKEYFVVFDLRQSIYTFANARPNLLKRYQRDIGAKVYSMNENYRCCPEILYFAKTTLQKCGMADDSVPVRDEKGFVSINSYSPQLIVDKVSEKKDYRNWAILTRTNSQIDEIKSILKAHKIPCDGFKQGDLKKEELDEKLQENTVKVLTVHSAKGLEWKNVICVGLRFWSPEECRISYVGVTRAKDNIIWMKQEKKKKVKTVSWE